MKNSVNLINITDFGAVGDGKTLNTSQIQSALDYCHNHGGGTVVIPQGVFVSGTLELKTNTHVYLSAGAVLKGSEKIEDYRSNGFVHNELGETRSLIYSIGHKDIHVSGEGIIDFSGCAFMDFDDFSGGIIPKEQLTKEQINECVVKANERPTQPVFFHNCSDISIQGIRFEDAPCWTITFSLCKFIKVHNITVMNHQRIPNCDGIHFCGSTDAVVSDSIFTCGDDCIAITGITDWDSVSERIAIHNCIMSSRSAALRAGHLASKVRNITVSNLIIHGSNRGIAVFAGDNGWVRNVSIDNVIMETKIYAGGWWGKGEPLVVCAADSEGCIEAVTVKNVKAECENSIVIIGKRGNINHIILSDWSIRFSYGKNTPQYGKYIDIQPAGFREAVADEIPWLIAEGIDTLSLNNIDYSKKDGKQPIKSLKERITDVKTLLIHHVREKESGKGICEVCTNNHAC